MKIKSVALSLIVSSCFLFSCTEPAANITIQVVEPIEDGVLSIVLDKDNATKEVALDENGMGVLNLEGVNSQYGQLRYNRSNRTIYIDPTKELSVTFNGDSMWKNIEFAGDNAEVNKYLNSGQIRTLNFNDSKVSVENFMSKGDSLLKANESFLAQANLPEEFVNKEQTRLVYYTKQLFPLYPIYNRYNNNGEEPTLTKEFYDEIRKLAVYDAKLLALKEYKDFIANAVACLSEENKDSEAASNTDSFIAYIDSHVTEPKVAEYLVNFFVYSQVKNSGLDNTDYLFSMFDKHVKDASLKSKMDELCGKWKALVKGAPSPQFTCEDIDGKTVSLTDLKGKLVYIDVWATWCGPCRGEIPHLKALEEEFRGEDIHFVSISVDSDKEAWVNMVNDEELKGVQLYLGTGSSFAKEYLINGIPRFILLDKEGAIIAADMTRPSNPKTAETLKSLL